MNRRHSRSYVAATIVGAALGLAACTAGAPPDGRDAVAIGGGKADGAGYSSCERNTVVRWLNDAQTTRETLTDAGVHSRSAGNLIAHRNGPDGTYGTEDDDPFDDIHEVDSVPWVGPVAMGSLVDAIGDRCVGELSCLEQSVVGWLNAPQTTRQTIVDAGVHGAAATRLIDHRNGPDGVYGTEDDDPFDDIREVYDVPYVGPAAQEQLRDAVAHRCTERSVEVLFSPQPRDESQLARAEALIDEAERSVDVAMYSFREAGIRRALRDAVQRGVSVRMILNTARDDRKDLHGTVTAGLEEDGIDVRWVNKIMHHKFAIIDGPRQRLDQANDSVVITGSGNWSSGGGTVYDENTLVIDGLRELVLRFQKEFNLLWENSRDVEANPDLEYFTSLPIADADVPDDPAVDAVFTSANFRTYDSSTYGPTFATMRGHTIASDTLVDLIGGADERIWIASGHLRLRAVAEALIEKHHADPGVEIRVLLDSQEYVSEWKHEQQLGELEDCLGDADSDERAREDCLRGGFMFSYQVHDAGIPLRYKYYAYRWHYSYAKQMHHKYFLVDDTLATGSFNLSYTAETGTMENIVILDGEVHGELLKAYEDNFEHLWRIDADRSLYAGLMSDVREGNDAFPIVFDPMSLTWPEVDELRRAMRKACPDINAPDYRNHPERHHYCDPR